MLDLVLDTVLPGDETLGMPPASRVDFKRYIEKHGVAEVFDQFVLSVQKAAIVRCGASFEILDSEERLAAINSLKRSDVRLFSRFLSHCFRAYYSDGVVLCKVGAGVVPPFPDGNEMPSDDWSLLEPVYERGKIFKEVC